ncbi:polysaccharide deacetylase family protein [Aneurinibacillus thermoaerophilus]|uniref:Polysaccharide deacetylase family sporulation protein PdaB n=1 Tax=Aneurinibacillus thermoaerophilus TaxID=143495 RepID=A0A1G8ED19_ANETH|nr:polysaccharide deacetylase family protein [Aneurinibacillus thermoaerophilus]MED0758865.1 polysaccharide deacetylase family protein [Aneurinibacillus thermoaerophilus]MED0761850.1 polysaccharide deacetylase family protein [Aneurinibacillus thermoaerophilus]SDH67835.1 polysaccharide deacetylase family sporulation protein PdaB [Aneurinibacillus thermoaerophilus]
MTKRFFFIVFLSLLCINNYETAYGAEKNRAYWESTGKVVWEVNTKEKVIALTFDDGPDPLYTPQIIQLLNKYQAKATFFVVGQKAKNNPAIIKELKQNGHEIGNHTYFHPSLYRISFARLKKEIEDTDSIIYAITGVSPTFFRPPGGVYNEKVVEAAKQGNHLLVMWSWTQDTKDWKNPGIQKIVDKVCKNAKPGNIVLFHDAGGNRTQTVQALDIILNKLSKEGYTFVTVSQLLAYKDRNVDSTK